MSAATLVTGATDGIGLALGRLLVERGEEPWLHGRLAFDALDPQRHPRSMFAEARYLRADLAAPDAARRIAAELEARGVTSLDRLVLNAGTGWMGRIEDQSEEALRTLLDVNLWSCLALTHALLPCLRRGRGRVTFVSSVVSALPVPDYAAYAASKAALEGLARSLRSELAGEVEVQVLRPGGTRTGLYDKSGGAEAGIDASRFPSAEEVARAVLRALDGPPRWTTIGLGNRAVRFAGRNLPRVLDRVQEIRAVRGRKGARR